MDSILRRTGIIPHEVLPDLGPYDWPPHDATISDLSAKKLTNQLRLAGGVQPSPEGWQAGSFAST